MTTLWKEPYKEQAEARFHRVKRDKLFTTILRSLLLAALLYGMFFIAFLF